MYHRRGPLSLGNAVVTFALAWKTSSARVRVQFTLVAEPAPDPRDSLPCLFGYADRQSPPAFCSAPVAVVSLRERT